MSVIRKRGNTWYIDFYLDGKRHVKAIGKSKKIAELALKDIEVKIAKKKAGFPTGYKISDWKEEFYRYIEAHLRPTTVQRYKESITWFLEFLERLPDSPVYLSEITPQHLEDFKIERLNQGRKRKTINNDLATIRRFFNLAIKRGYLIENPMQKVELFKLTDRKFPRFLTKEELERIYSELSEEDRDIVKVLANTGMRWGELRHLEWKDVDFENRLIKIRSKIMGNGKRWQPKTGSDRDIPMNRTVYSILSKRRRTKGFVFTTREGNILHPNNLRVRLQKVCDRLRIENVSNLVMEGVDIPTMMKLSGHKDIRIAQIYMHLARDHVRKAVERIEL